MMSPEAIGSEFRKHSLVEIKGPGRSGDKIKGPGGRHECLSLGSTIRGAKPYSVLLGWVLAPNYKHKEKPLLSLIQTGGTASLHLNLG